MSDEERNVPAQMIEDFPEPFGEDSLKYFEYYVSIAEIAPEKIREREFSGLMHLFNPEEDFEWISGLWEELSVIPQSRLIEDGELSERPLSLFLFSNLVVKEGLDLEFVDVDKLTKLYDIQFGVMDVETFFEQVTGGALSYILREENFNRLMDLRLTGKEHEFILKATNPDVEGSYQSLEHQRKEETELSAVERHTPVDKPEPAGAGSVRTFLGFRKT